LYYGSGLYARNDVAALNHVMAAMLKLLGSVENQTLSVVAYSLEQSCQSSFRSDLNN